MAQQAHVAEDLAMFSKHGKRVQINTDDVKLLARKNPDLHSHLAAMATQLTKTDPSAAKSKKK
ncbi:hypothetical protein H4R35_001515 [Dimargaris xerosporica]|nr:hypothetical protein H4R35_001515 [Dimargaris xerosporica]